jgi:predicted DNA-binding transcriptional regulator YafY
MPKMIPEPARKPRTEQQEVRRQHVSAQGARLRWIELRLRFLGEIRLSDLEEQFGVNTVTASRDLATYRELNPKNMESTKGGKSNRRAPTFLPSVRFTAHEVLETLTTGVVSLGPNTSRPAIKALSPPPLHEPDLNVLAAITEGLFRSQVVAIIYCSPASGDSRRQVVPVVLASNGVRWHVRAYDRKSGSFRDFVLTRISSATLLDDFAKAGETRDDDKQWRREVDLLLAPKPNVRNPKAIEMEYGMSDGTLRVSVPAALVDCSPDASLAGPEYQLCLRNQLSLVDVANLGIAPGYVAPAGV